MIQANELRIGNYLTCASLLCKVELIHDARFDCRTIEGMFIPNGKYEPIPLTEEWLLKFGFNLDCIDVNTQSRVAIKNKVEFLYSNQDKELSLRFNTDLGIIKHVHSLQNLYFALTGKELEIKHHDYCSCKQHSEYQVSGKCPVCKNQII